MTLNDINKVQTNKLNVHPLNHFANSIQGDYYHLLAHS